MMHRDEQWCFNYWQRCCGRKGDYVFTRVCFSVRPSVCLLTGLLEKTTDQIVMNYFCAMFGLTERSIG